MLNGGETPPETVFHTVLNDGETPPENHLKHSISVLNGGETHSEMQPFFAVLNGSETPPETQHFTQC